VRRRNLAAGISEPVQLLKEIIMKVKTNVKAGSTVWGT
jgi:hypothetical protein